MLDRGRPQSVVAFTGTAGHPAVVSACAGRRTPVMMEKPLAVVTAVTRRLKPEVYPRVDDEATVILEYPAARAIIQASWNWPFDRKDMEIYGRTGQVLTAARDGLRVRLAGEPEESRRPPELRPPGDDFLRYFAAVVRGEVKPSGLSSLRNNMIVVEILDAAPLRRDRPHGAADPIDAAGAWVFSR